MVGVAGTGAKDSCLRIKVDGSIVVPLEIVEVGDVVIRLNRQQLQMPLLRVSPQSPVSVEGAREVAQTDITNSEVIQENGKIICRFEPLKRLLTALVEHESFFEAVLTMQDVPQIGVQPSQSQLITLCFEYFARSFLAKA